MQVVLDESRRAPARRARRADLPHPPRLRLRQRRRRRLQRGRRRRRVVLLPRDPDASARALRARAARAARRRAGGRRSPTASAAPGATASATSRSAAPGSRRSTTGAGAPTRDGRELRATWIAVADEARGRRRPRPRQGLARAGRAGRAASSATSPTRTARRRPRPGEDPFAQASSRRGRCSAGRSGGGERLVVDRPPRPARRRGSSALTAPVRASAQCSALVVDGMCQLHREGGDLGAVAIDPRRRPARGHRHVRRRTRPPSSPPTLS